MPINTINQPNDLRYIQFYWHRLKPTTRRWIFLKVKWAMWKSTIRMIWDDVKIEPTRLFFWLEFFYIWSRMTKSERHEWYLEAKNRYSRRNNTEEKNTPLT